MTQLYICAHCNKEATPPGSTNAGRCPVVHCRHCLRMTNTERARQLGERHAERAFYEEAAQRQSDQMPELCEDEGCPHHGTKHVCVTDTRAELQAELQGARMLLRKVLDSGLMKRGAKMTEDVRRFLATSAAPKPVELTYAELEAISDQKEVNEALVNFSHDSTGDNAVELVRAIIEATKPKC